MAVPLRSSCLQPRLACCSPPPLCPQVRIISFGVMLFLPMTLLSMAVLLPINYTSDFYLYMGVRCWQLAVLFVCFVVWLQA
jgi:hypothetical protein